VVLVKSAKPSALLGAEQVPSGPFGDGEVMPAMLRAGRRGFLTAAVG
jgi:hypothetical protein